MIRKAIIPAAGLGTRFLPATKAQPKEMLPIIDTPVIQHVVQEAIDSGIEDILIISGRGKRAIEDHFDRNSDLELQLSGAENEAALNEIRRISDLANIHFVRQKEIRGLGDAIYHARMHAAGEPFVVLLGDTIVDSAIPATQQLIDVFDQYRCSVIGVEHVPVETVSRYGIVAGVRMSDRIHEVDQLVEKPHPESSPSDLAIAGRYILTPDIFKAIEKTAPDNTGEIQLTDALRLVLKRERIISCTIEGTRYDIGNKLDYLKTMVDYGLKRKEFAAAFRAYLASKVGNQQEDKDA